MLMLMRVHSLHNVCVLSGVRWESASNLTYAIFFFQYFFELHFNQKEADVMNCFNGHEWRK